MSGWMPRAVKALKALDPLDVFLVGGLGCLFAGVWTLGGLGWALTILGFVLVLIWSLTLCRSPRG